MKYAVKSQFLPCDYHFHGERKMHCMNENSKILHYNKL